MDRTAFILLKEKMPRPPCRDGEIDYGILIININLMIYCDAMTDGIGRNRWLLIAAVAAAGVLTILATALATSTSAEALKYKGVTRDFWVFNEELPGLDENKTGIPADIFSLQTIVVKKGDTVNIHLFNLETSADDQHSFTIYDKPYDKIDKVLKGGENGDISFVATKTGVFTYECKFHQPTMRGQLVVEAPTLDELRG